MDGRMDRMERRLPLGTGVLLFIALATITAWAQLPTATILGTVKDSSGAVVPEATVTATNQETGLTRVVKSASNGSYRFSALPVGAYEVRAEQAGFQAKVQSGLHLNVGDETVLNFTLEVGSVTETVSVTAEAPLVETTSGSLGSLVGEKTVADLPLNGRNYIDLTLLQPGVSQHKFMSTAATTVGTWYSSNGAPLRSNNYMLDGAVTTNLNGATSASTDGSTLGIEGIREYRVITNSFSAEYGMTMGSQVTMVSKSGTNSFHGSLFEYLRNSALDARNFFDYPSAATKPGFRLPPFKRNQFGATAGGPIKKDKTFFFTAYEGLRERFSPTKLDQVPAAGCHGTGGTVVTSAACPDLKATASVTILPVIAPFLALVPSPNLPPTGQGVSQFTYPAMQPTREDYGMVRIDQTFSSNDTFFGRYTVDDTLQVVPDNFPYPEFANNRISRAQYLTLSDNHIFSPTLLTTVRASFSRTNVVSGSGLAFVGPQYSLIPGFPLGGLSITGLTGLSGPTSPNVQKQNIFTYSDDTMFTRGRHAFKFGALINHYQQYMVTTTFQYGSVSFPDVASFLQGLATSEQAATPGSVLDRTYHFNTLGFYAQDDLKLWPRLTLNLGLRYEFQTEVNEATGRGSAVRNLIRDTEGTVGSPYRNASLKNFSPRFGFAWDILGNGTTSLRGGFAELYDLGIYGAGLVVSVTGTPPFSSQSQITGTPAKPIAFNVPLVFDPATVRRSLRTQDYYMQQPHLLSYNLTLARQLPWRMAISLGYAGSRGINLTQSTEGNPIVAQGVPVIGANGVRSCTLASTPPASSAPKCYFTTADPRTSPNWDAVEWKTGGGDSWYNSMQMVVSKQMSQGLQLQSSYTWSKAIDTTQGQFGAENGALGGGAPQDSSNPSADRAPAAFDIEQNWRLNTIYQLPSAFGKDGILGNLASGWQLSGIVTLQSGFPFNVSVGNNWSRAQGGGDRPDLAPGRDNSNITHGTSTCTDSRAGQKLGTRDLYFDPCGFILQPAGFLGNAGRNILRGPGVANLDMSLVKSTRIKYLGESGNLEFRAEFFNILNRPTFGVPSRGVYAGRSATEAPQATAGVINDTGRDKSRQIQFALKILF